MLQVFSEENFQSAKSREKLPLKCKQCNNIFYLPKNEIQKIRAEASKNTGEFCKRKCSDKFHNKRKKVKCKQCNNLFEKESCKIKKNKNNFCCQSCSATYNNAHKKHGTRRSKLEIYLEEQLTQIYPNLKILYNDKETINSELDIYIPSLSLAFELNGIFHYEPIYGQKKLAQIQNNDNRKYQACIEYNIELCIIDVSGLKYFKPKNAQRYLDIITNIVNSKI